MRKTRRNGRSVIPASGAAKICIFVNIYDIMPLMKGKIKNLFSFLSRAWRGGARGKLGIILALFAGFMFIGLFWGDVNVQRFAMNTWHLKDISYRAVETLEKVDFIACENPNNSLKLLQNYSPDYIEELGLKYLNIGDAQVKILKI